MTPTPLQNLLALVGRLLFALLFVPAGISKITGFSGTAGYIASVGLPLPEVGAGVALIVGFQTRWAALILAAFTLAASVFFHGYWAMPAEQQFMQQLLFFKNIAVVGGLLTLAAWGAGAWSLDGRNQR
jgi:putative oxidoreductase